MGYITTIDGTKHEVKESLDELLEIMLDDKTIKTGMFYATIVNKNIYKDNTTGCVFIKKNILFFT